MSKGCKSFDEHVYLSMGMTWIRRGGRWSKTHAVLSELHDNKAEKLKC